MLDAAVAVFSQHGFHAASVDEIAEVAGISKPMVYAYLGTKEELFIACLHREGPRLMEALVATPWAPASADQQLWRGLRAFFGFVAEHRDGWYVLYRQARGQEPFANVLSRSGPGWPRWSRACWRGAGLAGRPGRGGDRAHGTWSARPRPWPTGWSTTPPDPEVAATRLMNVVWLGAGALLPAVMLAASAASASVQVGRRLGHRAGRRPSRRRRAAENATVAGSRIGSLKATSTVYASGSRPSSAARQRALLHMPCAIGRGKPNSRAPSREVWIGLWSPETSA